MRICNCGLRGRDNHIPEWVELRKVSTRGTLNLPCNLIISLGMLPAPSCSSTHQACELGNLCQAKVEIALQTFPGLSLLFPGCPRFTGVIYQIPFSTAQSVHLLWGQIPIAIEKIRRLSPREIQQFYLRLNRRLIVVLGFRPKLNFKAPDFSFLEYNFIYLCIYF